MSPHPNCRREGEDVVGWIESIRDDQTARGRSLSPRYSYPPPFRPWLPTAIALIDEAVTFRRVQMEPDPVDQFLGAARIARPQIFSVSAAPISRFSAI